MIIIIVVIIMIIMPISLLMHIYFIAIKSFNYFVWGSFALAVINLMHFVSNISRIFYFLFRICAIIQLNVFVKKLLNNCYLWMWISISIFLVVCAVSIVLFHITYIIDIIIENVFTSLQVIWLAASIRSLVATLPILYCNLRLEYLCPEDDNILFQFNYFFLSSS